MSRYREISAFAKAFAKEYRGFMKSNDITNLELAARLGRTDGYVSERATGKRPLDADDVDALAALVDGWTGRSLMIELARRVRVNLDPSSADESSTARPNLQLVGGSGEDVDPHEIDLSKADLELAATHDRSGIKEQDHPEYENESQDTENGE